MNIKLIFQIVRYLVPTIVEIINIVNKSKEEKGTDNEQQQQDNAEGHTQQ